MEMLQEYSVKESDYGNNTEIFSKGAANMNDYEKKHMEIL